MSLILLFWNNISLIFSTAAIFQAFSLDLGMFVILFLICYMLINSIGIPWVQITCKILLPFVALGFSIWKTPFPSAAIILSILAVVCMLIQLFASLFLANREKKQEQSEQEE